MTSEICDDETVSLQILCAKNPWEARQLGESIQETEAWEECRLEKMKSILLCKVNTVPEVKQALRNTGTKKIIVTGKRDKIWACGANKYVAELEEPSLHSGRNLLGILWESIRSQLIQPAE